MRVYSPSPDFSPLAEITTYKRIQIIRRFIGRSVMQIDLPVEADIVSYMQKNCWIIADDDEPFIIRNIAQTEQTVTVYAFGGHFGFEGRITIPDEGMYAIEKTGSADVVIKEFITKSTPVGNRSLNIVCAANQGGAVISDQSRLKNLGDEVARILVGAGLGERFRISGSSIIFDTYPGTDRSASCVFDLKYKNVKDFTYTLDATKTQSTPIVGGAGEGADREMYITGDDAAGWDRREVFIDARDVTSGDLDTLTQRAAQALIGDDQEVKADVASSANLIFGVDYFLGDIATVNVQVKTYEQNGVYFNPATETVPLVVRITDATETIDNGVRTNDLTFGSTILQSDTVQTRSSIAQLQSTEPSGSQMAAQDILTQLKTVDGAGSGLDTDLFDGKESALFLLTAAYTGADVLTKLKTVAGSGSGLDADKLDGNEAAAFLLATAYTAADVLAKIKTVSGSGSGLDADKVDGKDASYFLAATAQAADSAKLAGLLASQLSVNYANTAGSAPANGGNADTVDGLHNTGLLQLLGQSGFKIVRGTCTLSSASWTTVSMGQTFGVAPYVFLCPETSNTGVIPPKCNNVTTTQFDATIGGSGVSSTAVRWIAIGT